MVLYMSVKGIGKNQKHHHLADVLRLSCYTREKELSMKEIKISRGNDFFFDKNPITKELLSDERMQTVYYNFKDKDSLGITPDKDASSLMLYILEGKMVFRTSSGEIELCQNDSMLLSEFADSGVLAALCESKCLTISTSHSQHIDGSNELMNMVEAVETKDVYTHGHSRRVALYAIAIATAYASDYDIITLGKAADLHDIGKIVIPIEILQKPGKLTEEEYDIIKTHALESYNILLPVYGHEVAMIARQHHERLDGSGYPDGRKGDEISLNARIVAIADVFDALTCKRIYNSRPMSFDEALCYLEGLPSHYDSNLVALLREKERDGSLKKNHIHTSFTE